MSVDWTYLPCHFMLSKLNCQAFAHFAQLTIFPWQKKNFQRNPNIKWLVIIYLIVSFSCHTEINIKEFIDLLIKAKLYNCNKLRFINSIIRKTTANRLEYNSCTFFGCFLLLFLFQAEFCQLFLKFSFYKVPVFRISFFATSSGKNIIFTEMKWQASLVK